MLLGLGDLIQPLVFAVEEIQDEGDDWMQDHKKDHIQLLVGDAKQVTHPNQTTE